MKTQRGFTIIELIVVIAIIAVLAAIVLVNVTSYLGKGKAAAIQGNMGTLLTNAAVYFDSNPTNFGDDFVANTTTGCGAGGTIDTAITNAGGDISCFGDDDTQDWCGVVAAMPTGSSYASYCVDNNGYKGLDGGCATTQFTCQ